MPYRIKPLMRSVNKIWLRVLDRGVHEGQNKILVIKSSMLWQRAYVFMLCWGPIFYVLLRAYVLCFMFCWGSMFYVLLRVYVLCFYVLQRAYVSMFCIRSMLYVLLKFYILCIAKGLWDRLKKTAIMGIQMQQSLSAFAPKAIYLDLTISQMQNLYFAINMKKK